MLKYFGERVRSKRLLYWAAPSAIAMAALAVLPPLAAGQVSAETSLDFEAQIAGTTLQKGTETPVKLVASEPTRIRLVVGNKGPNPQEIVGVRFEGKVVGIPVFRCDVLAPTIVAPGETIERTFDIDPACLRDQATGLVPASLTVNGPRQTALMRWSMVLDIKGSLKSIYGLTGAFTVLITFFALASLLASLVRQKLPRNRFSRALRFTTVGIGVGFSLVFTLASAAIVVPDAENWIPIVVIPAVVFTIGGFLSPTPQREGEQTLLVPDATQAMPRAWPSADRTEILPQAASTDPIASQGVQDIQATVSAGTSEATATAGTWRPGFTQQDEVPSDPRSTPMKKVRPVSSQQVSEIAASEDSGNHSTPEEQ